MLHDKKILNLLLTTLFTIIIIYLIYKQIIYPTILPVVKNGVLILSSDWSVIVNASICDSKGYDVFINNPCDPFGSKHVYGEILLKLPFVTLYPDFYYLVVPIIIGILFIYTVVSFFSFGNSKQYYWLSFFYIFFKEKNNTQTNRIKFRNRSDNYHCMIHKSILISSN